MQAAEAQTRLIFRSWIACCYPIYVWDRKEEGELLFPVNFFSKNDLELEFRVFVTKSKTPKSFLLKAKINYG